MVSRDQVLEVRKFLVQESAKGAKYDSQGQARSEAERVAPGKNQTSD